MVSIRYRGIELEEILHSICCSSDIHQPPTYSFQYHGPKHYLCKECLNGPLFESELENALDTFDKLLDFTSNPIISKMDAEDLWHSYNCLLPYYAGLGDNSGRLKNLQLQGVLKIEVKVIC